MDGEGEGAVYICVDVSIYTGDGRWKFPPVVRLEL